MLAAQLANQAGLTVVATTRNPQKEKAILENGATHVLIDLGQVTESVRAIFPQGIDKVLELVTFRILPAYNVLFRHGTSLGAFAVSVQFQ